MPTIDTDKFAQIFVQLFQAQREISGLRMIKSFETELAPGAKFKEEEEDPNPFIH